VFEGLSAGETMVKMKKPGKKKTLTASWEGPYLFVAHTDGLGTFDADEGNRICILQDGDGNQWERPRRDLHVYHLPSKQKS
jgi:hypothetical protein